MSMNLKIGIGIACVVGSLLFYYFLKKKNQKKSPPKIVKKLTDYATDEMVIPGKKDIRILSIDGGGIRGILPSIIIREIQKKTGKHPCELFDLVAGTSIGGIVSLALTCKSKEGTPRYSADEVVEILKNNGDKIFNSSIKQTLSSLGGLADEKYSAKGLEEVLKNHLDDSKLSDALVPVMVTSFELSRYTPFIFKSWDKKNDFLARYAGRATSAAPTYFELAKIQNLEGTSFSCIDGGVIMNDPSLQAYVEAKRLYPDAEKFTIISIGTGKYTPDINDVSAQDWGVIEWIRPLINLMMDGNSKATHKQMKKVFPESYFRLETRLTADIVPMDNVSKENIENLVKNAEEYITSKAAKIDEICKILMTPRIK